MGVSLCCAVGSERKITYKDGAVWTIKLTELSDTHTSVSWDLMTADSVAFTSRSDTITLREVTEVRCGAQFCLCLPQFVRLCWVWRGFVAVVVCC